MRRADGRITLVNAQAERLFGYRRDELIGQPVEILVPERRADRAPRPPGPATSPTRGPRPMGAGHAAGRPPPGRQRVPGRDLPVRHRHRARHARHRRHPRRHRTARSCRPSGNGSGPRPSGTGWKRQLHQSQRLESLGQLAGGVAHDFNNLLAVITNYAAFVGEEASAQDRPAGRLAGGPRRHRRRSSGAAERATELTHQLLAFARRDVVQPRVLDLNDVVTEVEQLLRAHPRRAHRADRPTWPPT